MVDARLDTKLTELARELRFRPLVPGQPIADAFALRGVDEAGKPGLFAAVLLPPNFDMGDLDLLTRFRAALTARLKQLHATLPAWPIIVQGTPELMDGKAVVPGGREYFEQLKGELSERLARSLATAPHTASTTPVVSLPSGPAPVATPAKAVKKPAKVEPVKKAKKLAPAKVSAGARAVKPRASARVGKARKAR